MVVGDDPMMFLEMSSSRSCSVLVRRPSWNGSALREPGDGSAIADENALDVEEPHVKDRSHFEGNTLQLLLDMP